MIQTIEAVIDEQGKAQLLQDVRLPPQVRRALVTILEEKPTIAVSETALLSEAALAEDWDRPEEDEAWSYLQAEQTDLNAKEKKFVNGLRQKGLVTEMPLRLPDDEFRRNFKRIEVKGEPLSETIIKERG